MANVRNDHDHDHDHDRGKYFEQDFPRSERRVRADRRVLVASAAGQFPAPD